CDVTNIVQVEKQQCSEFRLVESGARPLETIFAQAVEIDALLEVYRHRSGRTNHVLSLLPRKVTLLGGLNLSCHEYTPALHRIGRGPRGAGNGHPTTRSRANRAYNCARYHVWRRVKSTGLVRNKQRILPQAESERDSRDHAELAVHVRTSQRRRLRHCRDRDG